MNKIIKRITGIDYILFSAVVIISAIGLTSIYSSMGFDLALRQGLFILFGFLLYLLLSFFDWRILKENSFLVFIIYLAAIGLLVGVLLFGPEIRNVQRWFRIGPIMFSPAEIAKIVLIIVLAKYFSMRHAELYKVRHIILSGIYAFIPIFLIFKQPDLGTAIIFVILWGGILLISGIKLKHFLFLCLIGILVVGLAWSFLLADYQKDRVTSFLNPEVDPQGLGWGARHAKVAIGNGGLLGQGIGEGTQTQLGFLPEPHTDFVFAAIAEEMGFVGVCLLIGAIGVMFWRILKIIFQAKYNFCRLFISGFLIILIFQNFVNIGMNLGFLPITGTPLPFVSYGGSSILFTFTGLGILENMRYNSN
jgi:rod shape determining protein RodA